MVKIEKPNKKDLRAIEKILSQWTEKNEVEKYVGRISNEINGKTEYNMHFWAAKDEGIAVGIVGLSDPLPKILPFTKTKTPVEIKILYVDGNHQGKGVGRSLVNFIENEAKKEGYKEIMVRSAKRYIGTAWGFYKKMNFNAVGEVTGGDDKKIMQVFSILLS